MRGDLYASAADDSARLLTEVLVELTPYRSAIEMLAADLLAAEDQTLSGDGLDAAIEAAVAVAVAVPFADLSGLGLTAE